MAGNYYWKWYAVRLCETCETVTHPEDVAQIVNNQTIQSWTLPAFWLTAGGPTPYLLSPLSCANYLITITHPKPMETAPVSHPAPAHTGVASASEQAGQEDPSSEPDFPPIVSYLVQLKREASQILPNLFLSDAFTARWGRTLDELKITHIISVLEEPVTFPTTVRPLKLLHIPASDNASTDLLSFMDQTTEFIKEAIGTNKQEKDLLESVSLGDTTEAAEVDPPITSGEEQENRVLVHCLAGMSRSATIVIAYLLATTPMTTEEATAFVRSKRSVIRPNQGFTKQLEQYERRHFSSAGKTNKPKRRVESGLASRIQLYRDVAAGVRRNVE